MKQASDAEVLKRAEATHGRRMRWWRESRMGLFIHWGLYAQLARGEWALNRECIPPDDYRRLADTWHPKPGFARGWARLARQAGMKYMVLTTKHCEGFCLWDTAQTRFNAVRTGPGRDLVAEYVEACRAEGLKVGFYYSAMDWSHPDWHAFTRSAPARRRLIAFTQECLRELMTNYGRIDVMWFDAVWPLPKAEIWQSEQTNAMIRRLQPDIIINDRNLLPEDHGTPEGHIAPADRDWEACMTLNDGEWGYGRRIPEDWASIRQILLMLRQVTSAGGNLLLNIGPLPDGSVDPLAEDRLRRLGRWAARNGEAIYGRVDRIKNRIESWNSHGWYTLKGEAIYLWLLRGYPYETLIVGGIRNRVRRVTLLGSPQPLRFRQTPVRLEIDGLPLRNPDRAAYTPVVKIECEGRPRQKVAFIPPAADEWRRPVAGLA
jgi:alpha-L-fucosidase